MAHVEPLQVHQQRPGGYGPAIGGSRLLRQPQAFLADVQSLESRGRCDWRFEGVSLLTSTCYISAPGTSQTVTFIGEKLNYLPTNKKYPQHIIKVQQQWICCDTFSSFIHLHDFERKS